VLPAQSDYAWQRPMAISPKPGLDGSATASSSRLREVAVRLADDSEWIPAVSGEITDAIHRELPELGTDEQMRAATYASSESNVRQFIDILRIGSDPAEAGPPPAAVDYARQFVRSGVTIDSLLRAYHVGQATFAGRLSSAVRAAIDDRDEVSEALERGAVLTFAYVNALIRDLIERYAEERDRWVRSAAAVRADTVRALLADEPIDLQAAERRLGYLLQRSHMGFVVWSSPRTEEVDDVGALERAAATFAADLGGTGRLLVPFGPHLIVGWVAVADRPASRGRLRVGCDAAPGARAAIGEPGSGIDGFTRSHREAMQARRIAELTGRPPGSVIAHEAVALTALASADLDQARDFVFRQLGPLAADDDDTLRLSGTLRVYLEERSSPRRTAERLGVHANTVTNRIRAAQEQLGEPIESRVSELLVALRLAPVVQHDALD
jgi:DNA-binding PucR family transcriptional regulator